MLVKLKFDVKDSMQNVGIAIGDGEVTECLSVPRSVLTPIIGAEWSTGWWNDRRVYHDEPGTGDIKGGGRCGLVVGHVEHDLTEDQVVALRAAAEADKKWRKENDPYKQTGVYAREGAPNAS